MAALALSPPRPAGTPGRHRRKHSLGEAATEPPHKKRKYIPGGPGGGGRYLDDQGNELVLEPATVERSLSHARPRSRTARRSSEKAVRPSLEDDGDDDDDDDEPPTVTRSAMSTRPRRERPDRYAPRPSASRPRYPSSAAAAAAASQASDGYKPREERSWDEFHPELEIDISLPIYSADDVDGRVQKKELPKGLQRANSGWNEAKPALNGEAETNDVETETQETVVTPVKRKPGRPPRRPESMLSGLGSPPAPRIIPLPTHSSKERLNLPKPSYRQYNHFLQYEDDQQENKKNYVDRTMANVGYQESDRYELPPKVLVRLFETAQMEDDAEVGLHLESDGPVEATSATGIVGKVEYDMDEQDVMWLEGINEQRKSEGVDAIKPAIFEITMTQIEKEYHALEKRIPKPQPRHAQMHRPRSSSQAAVNGDPNPPGDEPDSKCSICDDGDCENANAIIFCDGCDLAVHQECYGVPFIPEGQWFCRKCKEIGRGTPTCIFCPNVDGAFKQTNTLRWSHLLCALWIPEVTVANMTFMEPIQDVDKVPKSRWKLHCYICNQKMGACIQCGNKNCYQAFHVTCARRGKLFLKMKSSHHQGIDTSALKAFCDKHVPPDWRRVHDTDNAIVEAKRWYRHAMKDRRWADSQTAALELGAPPPPDGGLTGEDDTIAVTKRRKNASTSSPAAKQSWRLPSGAPVVPAAVYKAVEASLIRFTVRKRKEFVERMCRYWTLKRESRRGASLLKRLQLQLEGFSSMEVTRRNFAAMGAVGRSRLERRIDLGEALQANLAHVGPIVALLREREALRLKEVETLRELVDTVYFPISKLLWPILMKARKLDEKTNIFYTGFENLTLQLRERYYTSVADFSAALSRVLDNSDHEEEADRVDLQHVNSRTLTAEQKEVAKLRRRIARAIKDPLAEATRKEAELTGRDEGEMMRRLDGLSIFATVGAEESPVKSREPRRRVGSEASANGGAEMEAIDVEMTDADADGEEDPDADAEGEIIEDAEADQQEEEEEGIATHPHRSLRNQKPTPAASSTSSDHNPSANTKSTLNRPAAPMSPPPSTSPASHTNPATAATAPASADDDTTSVFAQGGIPWYLAPFDLHGTTVHEERYTGSEVLRGMSEELSEVDEDTLGEWEIEGGAGKGEADGVVGGGEVGKSTAKKGKKRKGGGQGWGRRRR